MGMQPTGNVLEVKCLFLWHNSPSMSHLMKYLFFNIVILVFNPLTCSDKKSLQQISHNSLCGLNQVAIDVDQPRGDVCFLIAAPEKCSCCGKDIILITDFHIKDFIYLFFKHEG